MTNPHRGNTPVEVGGEKYTLCFDLNACAMVMERLGLESFEDLAEKAVSDKIGLREVVYMLWAGLQRNHPEMTEQDVGALEWDLQEVGPVLGDAFSSGLIRKTTPARTTKKKTKKKRGTGRKHG